MRGPLWPQDFQPVRFSDPFLDERLVRFLWSLPALPWFHQKHILRVAMKRTLPKTILRRPKTPARSWKDPSVSVFFRNWTPTPDLAQFVDLRRLPREFTNRTPIRDFYPLFFDLWLRESKEVIGDMRKCAKKTINSVI